MRCKYCNHEIDCRNDANYENCRIDWFECPNCLAKVQIQHNKSTWTLPKKMKNVFDNLIHEWEETGELTEEYETAIKFSNNYSEDDVLVFEFDKYNIEPEVINNFIRGMQEMLKNKMIFIPMDNMTCDSVSDIDYLIENYEMALTTLKTIKQERSYIHETN